MRIALKRCPIIAVALLLTIGQTLYAQDGANFILKLNDSLISSFKEFGSLRSPLPQNVQNRIDTVELRFAGTENQPVVSRDLEIKVDDGNAELFVDDSLLELVRKQPVRIPLNGITFQVIFLRYNAGAADNGGGVLMGDGPNRFVLELTDNKTLAGSVLDMTEISLVTNFGEVNVTLDQIAGIKFKADGEEQAVLFLSNGDQISGTPTLGVLNVETFWGLAEVNAENIRSMSTSPTARYEQTSTDFGTRWQLRMGTGMAPGARN